MNTKALRQKILDLAIHGKLVPQDPNDEPASVLLERIRAEKERLVKEGKIKRPKKTKATSDKPHYPYELPKGWVWTTLSEITSIIGDGLHGTPQYDIFGNYFFINGNNLVNRTIVIKEGTKKVSDDEYVKYRKPLNERTILVSINGTIGNVGTYNGEKIILGKSACYFNLLPDISKSYICNIIESDYFRKYAFKSATGSTIKNVPLKAINDFYIPLPPLQEQRRIVESIEHRLSFVDCIEFDKEKLQETIKQAKSKVLDLAIHGRLVPQDPMDEPASELLKHINPKAEITSDNGHYQKLPEGWVITSISEMCENINGLWKGKKEPFVKVGVIRNANFTKDFKLDYSKIEYIDVEERAFKKRHLLNGDLIVEKSGGSDNNPVGRAILYEGKDAIFSFSNFTMVLRILYKDVLSYKYLYYYIMSKYQKGEMRLMQTQTTGLHNLILDKYLDIPLCLPPYQEQQRIINKIEETFGVLDLIMENL